MKMMEVWVPAGEDWGTVDTTRGQRLLGRLHSHVDVVEGDLGHKVRSEGNGLFDEGAGHGLTHY